MVLYKTWQEIICFEGSCPLREFIISPIEVDCKAWQSRKSLLSAYVLFDRNWGFLSTSTYTIGTATCQTFGVWCYHTPIREGKRMFIKVAGDVVKFWLDRYPKRAIQSGESSKESRAVFQNQALRLQLTWSPAGVNHLLDNTLKALGFHCNQPIRVHMQSSWTEDGFGSRFM